MGLNDFSIVSKNLGYVLAMLPDMLIGMFIRNPLIKMLLIGFGGVNILNNAGHASLKEGLSRSSSLLKCIKNTKTRS